MEAGLLGRTAMRARMRRRRRLANPLDAPLLQISCESDTIRVADALGSVLVVADSGAGKSSAFLPAIEAGALACGFATVHTAIKPDDADRIRRFAARCNAPLREIDFTRERFNPLAWEAQRAPAEARTEQTLARAMEPLRQQRRQSRGGDPHWEGDATRYLRHILTIVLCAGWRPSWPILAEALLTLPQSIEETQESEWRERCPAFRALVEAAERSLPPTERNDLDAAARFLLHTAPTTPARTLASTVATYLAAVDGLCHGIIGEVLSAEADTWTPLEAISSPGVTVFTGATMTMGAAATLLQRLFLSSLQDEILRRPVDRSTTPVMLVCDEYAALADLDQDGRLIATGRSQLGCMVIAVQSVHSLASASATSSHGSAAAELLMGLPVVKILGSSTDPATCKWMSSVFARTWRARVSFGTQESAGGPAERKGPGRSTNVARELAEETPPFEFTRLARGSAAHGHCAEAFVACAGRVWSATGRSSIKARFPQTLF